MRVAIFSDVHGNLTALEAVLADIDRQAPDLIFFAGDLCVFGPRPAECVQRLRQRDQQIAGLYGNTDEWIDAPPSLEEQLDKSVRQQRQKLHDAAGWTGEQLTTNDRAWLSTLPFHRRVSPTTNPRDDLFIVHANPHDVNQVIYPTPARQEELYDNEVKQNDDELRRLIGDVAFGVLAFGHLHVPGVRDFGHAKLANISSVSLALDGDTRAKYGLLTWNGRHWDIEHQYVDYDLDKEVAAIKAAQPPDWESLAERLRRAGSKD